MVSRWKQAVWAAVQRRTAAQRGAFTRDDLVTHELARIVIDSGTRGTTPAQTMSRELQELRDLGVVLFDGQGRYRVAAGLRTPDLDTAIATERLRLLTCRVGQGGFRAALDRRWGGTCPLTGIASRELLRASHIVAWNRCESDAERLDPDNGLLLSALWDAAFDRGLVAFDDGGRALFAQTLDTAAGQALRQAPRLAIAGLSAGNIDRLRRHRAEHAASNFVRPH